MTCPECNSIEVSAPSHSDPYWCCADCGHSWPLPGMEKFCPQENSQESPLPYRTDGPNMSVGPQQHSREVDMKISDETIQALALAMAHLHNDMEAEIPPSLRRLDMMGIEEGPIGPAICTEFGDEVGEKIHRAMYVPYKPMLE